MPDTEPDPRFSLANERTFLAWMRTSLALVAGGVAAAKGLDFHHDLVRWLIATPPIVAGGLLAFSSKARWSGYEQAMRSGDPLPIGRLMPELAFGLAGYAILVLVACALD